MKVSSLVFVAAVAFVVGLVVLSQNGFAQEESIFEGELVAVNAEAQTITVVNSEAAQMTFAYDQETEVLGSESTIQGLSGQSGVQLRVSYTDPVNPMAKRIEVLVQ